MRRWTRIILTCVCLTTLVPTFGCGTEASADIALDRPWEALPEDAIGVAYFDVASLLDSDLYRALDAEGRIPSEPNAKLDEWQQATGFDPTTDLHSITIGAGYGAGDTDKTYYMIVKGKFDLARIDEYARDSQEVEIGTREGLKTYGARPQDPSSTETPVVAFLSPSTMIAASPADFPKLVRSVHGSAPGAASSSLGRLMSGSEGQVFLALHIPEEARDVAASPGGADGTAMVAGLQEPLRHMESVLLTIDVSRSFELTVTAEVDTAESGKLLHDTILGFLAMGKMMTAESPETAELLDQMTLRHDGKTLNLGVVLTREQIETAMDGANGTPAEVAIGG
jgi:hypothetical protein